MRHRPLGELRRARQPRRTKDATVIAAEPNSVRPLRGRFISFAGPKETNQRKGPSPTKRTGHRSGCGDFPTRHPWLGRKTMHILCIALRVCVDFGRSGLSICLILFRKKWEDLRSITQPTALDRVVFGPSMRLVMVAHPGSLRFQSRDLIAAYLIERLHHGTRYPGQFPPRYRSPGKRKARTRDGWQVMCRIFRVRPAALPGLRAVNSPLMLLN